MDTKSKSLRPLGHHANRFVHQCLVENWAPNQTKVGPPSEMFVDSMAIPGTQIRGT